MLLLAVATIIPYQGAVLILFLVHALSTLAAQPPPPAPLSAAATRPSASPTPASLTSAAPASRASQYVSVLALVLCGLLPTSAPVLAVWARDVLADWREPFTGDHNVLRVVGVVGTVAACEGGRFLAPDRKDQCVPLPSLSPPSSRARRVLTCVDPCPPAAPPSACSRAPSWR